MRARSNISESRRKFWNRYEKSNKTSHRVVAVGVDRGEMAVDEVTVGVAKVVVVEGEGEDGVGVDMTKQSCGRTRTYGCCYGHFAKMISSCWPLRSCRG